MREHPRKKLLRREKSRGLLQATAAILLLIAGSCSCAHKPGAAEPSIRPDVYVYDLEQSLKTGRCVFINEQERRVDTLEPSIHDFALIPFLDFERMQEKNQRCELWR